MPHTVGMHRINWVSAAFAAVLLCGCAGSSTSGGSPTPFEPRFDSETVAKLDTAVDDMMARMDIPGVVIGVWFPGRGTWIVAKGVRDTTTNEPMPINAHFRIGSNTKSFLGTVVLQLVMEGRIELDKPISDCIDGVPNGAHITVRQMLQMASGLPNYSETAAFDDYLHTTPFAPVSRQQLLDWAFAEPNEFEPGTRWQYSNTNSVLLGILVEARTGKSIAQNMKERIFDRLAMENTSWPTTADLPVPFSRGYSRDTANGERADATNWSPTWTDAAGILISNLWDMKRWAKSVAVGELLTPSIQAERLTWVELPGIGRARYGLHIGKSGGWINHQGEMPGYNTIGAYLPELDATIVVLANSSDGINGFSPVAGLVTVIGRILAPDYTPELPPLD